MFGLWNKLRVAERELQSLKDQNKSLREYRDTEMRNFEIWRKDTVHAHELKIQSLEHLVKMKVEKTDIELQKALNQAQAAFNVKTVDISTQVMDKVEKVLKASEQRMAEVLLLVASHLPYPQHNTQIIKRSK